jgi:hypothetical protein
LKLWHNKKKNENESDRYAKIFNFTFGHISFAAFLIAAISGVFLAIPFDIKNPVDSLSYMLLTNPGGVLFRNIHYWSAQIFLVFSILHIYDHLNKSTEKEVKTGVWLRLTFSLVVIFFVMLSGFIIKGDADSIQAKRIVTALFSYIPVIGKNLSLSIFGPDNNYQILYVQHIATATIFLWIIIAEHSKLIWPRLKTILYLLPFIILIGYLFPPLLHDGLNPIIKGPWYFLGLQEILHWLSFPAIIIILILLYLAAVAFLPKYSLKLSKITKRIIFISFIVYSVLIIIGYYFRGEDWKFVMPWNNPVVTEFQFEPFDNIKTVSEKDLEKKNIPVILGRREGCLYCHQNTKGFSPAHNPTAIGCVSCHLGNPFTLEKTYAHQGMILIPGNLDDAKRSCGTSKCHGEIVDRLNTTLMTTLSGIVSVDRYAFGETKNLNALNFIEDIDHSPSDNHLRNLCASCHLGGKKTELGPITQLSRGGGCNACHLNYNDIALASLSNYKIGSTKILDSANAFVHPSLSIKITNEHCFGCHSRSGRISTNYEGWHDTLLRPEDVKDTTNIRILDDGRVFIKAPEDIHHEKGMDCIDCHTSYEVMGDGKYYLHEEDQTKVTCTDCHFNGKPETKLLNQLDQESQKIVTIKNYDEKGREFLVVHKSGNPLINTYLNKDNKSELITQNSGKILQLKPPAFVCTEGKGHQDLSCKSCHTSWSPQCIGCHTQYNANETGYDNLTNKEVKGRWEETASDYLAEPPTLGIRITKDKKGIEKEIVDTFIPGMVLTIEKKNINRNSSEDKNIIFRRLFAPTFSHTITKESRSCESCHNNPVALGYGRGKLQYIKVGKYGKWIFTPKYPLSKYDGLPEDAWIGFLKTRKSYFATRTNVRPFNIDEQKNILTVGACLTCHGPKSKPIKLYLDKGEMPKVSSKCLLPKWN